jgi:hypothetical protein
MPLIAPIFTAASLLPGRSYRVKAAFMDYDGILHPAGETWRFIQKNFLPYEDGLTLTLEYNGQPRQVRLQWLPAAQAQIIDHFSDYVELLPKNAAAPNLPAPARPPKSRFWKRLAIGLVVGFSILALLLVGLFIGLGYLLSYRPSSHYPVVTPVVIVVNVNAPQTARLNQEYAMEIQVQNPSDRSLIVEIVQIAGSYLQGANPTRGDPAFQQPVRLSPDAAYTIFSFHSEVPAHSSRSLRLYLTPQKAGDFSGPVLVCIDNTVVCMQRQAHTIIIK